MSQVVKEALFVHGEGGRVLQGALQANVLGVAVTAVSFEALASDPTGILGGVGHVVVAGELAQVKTMLSLASELGIGVGILPLKGQKALRDVYRLPGEQAAQIELALRATPDLIDQIICNGERVMLKVVMGRLPIVDASLSRSRLRMVWRGIKGLFGLKLVGLRVTTAAGRLVQTAACGCSIVQRYGRRGQRLLLRGDSLTDGKVSVLVVAPMSAFSYLQSFLSLLSGRTSRDNVPTALGYIHSEGVTITSDVPLPVTIDGVPSTNTSLVCEVRRAAVRVNVGPGVAELDATPSEAEEWVDVGNLPAGKELRKAKGQHIPLFAYASEERFRDLFTALREDARISGTYIVLMVLSSLLATVGLFLNSASVVIGAMVLAPLMAPIMSLSMGLVRRDDPLVFRSLRKILVGIAIALGSAALFSLLITHKPVTPEMNARLNPSLLDLAVAILAGVAGAYTKSFKEILQSLAGVAIAVALVPPLAVAGIGLGRADPVFFSQAFLLFLTNLIGIAVAATLSFRVLGYSPVVRNRRGLSLVIVMLLGVSVPLFFSYRHIVGTEAMESNWRLERFLVGGKYLIVEKAEMGSQRGRSVLYVDVLAREPLTRSDLAAFKEKVQMHFSVQLVVRVRVIYIL